MHVHDDLLATSPLTQFQCLHMSIRKCVLGYMFGRWDGTKYVHTYICLRTWGGVWDHGCGVGTLDGEWDYKVWCGNTGW